MGYVVLRFGTSDRESVTSVLLLTPTCDPFMSFHFRTTHKPTIVGDRKFDMDRTTEVIGCLELFDVRTLNGYRSIMIIIIMNRELMYENK